MAKLYSRALLWLVDDGNKNVKSWPLVCRTRGWRPELSISAGLGWSWKNCGGLYPCKSDSGTRIMDGSPSSVFVASKSHVLDSMQRLPAGLEWAEPGFVRNPVLDCVVVSPL